MNQTYLVLREYYRINYYPIEILHIIVRFYQDINNIEVYMNSSILLKTSSNHTYICSDQKLNKIELPIARKIIHRHNVTFTITESNQLYAQGSNYKGQLGLGFISTYEGQKYPIKSRIAWY